MPTDWKDALASLMPETGNETTPDENASATDSAVTGKTLLPKLNIAFERKGRNGKCVTIIYGFDPGNEELLKKTAAELKKSIGIGGSARAGEILLQGDWREKAAELLKKSGFRVGSSKK